MNDVITNNTIFNNGGGIALTECSDNIGCNVMDYMNISNNVVVNNGVAGTGGQHFGINFYHVRGLHNVVQNNLIYGNLPSDYAHHDVTCIAGTPISGTDANGTAGGCPSTNPKSDPSIAATFVNFQSDTNSAPTSNYNPANYQLKLGSNAINQGTTSCAASPGISPCTPATDFSGKTRPNPPSIGAYEP